jgi:hypothetical protein
MLGEFVFIEGSASFGPWSCDESIFNPGCPEEEIRFAQKMNIAPG